jgi:hypothetical protein
MQPIPHSDPTCLTQWPFPPCHVSPTPCGLPDLPCPERHYECPRWSPLPICLTEAAQRMNTSHTLSVTPISLADRQSPASHPTRTQPYACGASHSSSGIANPGKQKANPIPTAHSHQAGRPLPEMPQANTMPPLPCGTTSPLAKGRCHACLCCSDSETLPVLRLSAHQGLRAAGAGLRPSRGVALCSF